MHNNISGNRRASQGVSIEILADVTNVQSLANKLSMKVLVSNDSVINVISKEELEEGFAYSLEVILQQDCREKVLHDVVPKFLGDLIMPIQTKVKGVVIIPTWKGNVTRPHSYQKYLDVMESIGIPCGKLLKPSEDFSSVLGIGRVKEQGVTVLVGIAEKISVEELVIRSLLEVSDAEEAKLRNIIGHMDLYYMAEDELLRQFGASLPVAR